VDDFKVLLVDDETEYLNTLIQRMQKRNLDVTGVGSAEEALKWLEQNAVDVVVLDVRMPGMDGIEALRDIKGMYPLVEVIMLTGHASVEVAIEGMELGAFDYLMKPMALDDLLYKIQDAHKKKMIQEEKISCMEQLIDKKGSTKDNDQSRR
jgi:DNA-binding NtrC family response regulator